MATKIITMDVTLNYMLSLNKEKELAAILNNSVLKDFEKMVEGNFITVHYAVLNEQDEKEKETN